MSNTTSTVLENCKISYARSGKTQKGNPSVSGILQQRNQDDRFQASFSFECYDTNIQAQLLSAADKIADTERDNENNGTVTIGGQSDESVRVPANTTVTVTGYYKTRAPKEGSANKEWRTSFIVESVTVVMG
jgi:hypothetical protein